MKFCFVSLTVLLVEQQFYIFIFYNCLDQVNSSCKMRIAKHHILVSCLWGLVTSNGSTPLVYVIHV